MAHGRQTLTSFGVALALFTSTCLAQVGTAAADPPGAGQNAPAPAPTPGQWSILRSSDGVVVTLPMGVSPGDLAAPGDYDGDGQANLAILRGATGGWFIQMGTGIVGPIQFVGAGVGDTPVPADYDGDGRTDLGIYRKSTGQWFIFGSTAGFIGPIVFGAPGLDLLPAAADYDGDGRADLLIYRKSTGQWFIFGSTAGFIGPIAFGAPGLDLLPAAADYDGDGRADLGLFRPSAGHWFFQGSSTGLQGPITFGGPLDLPALADYDGDGRVDLAVFRPAAAEICGQPGVLYCDLGPHPQSYFQIVPQFVGNHGFVQFDMSGFVIEGRELEHSFLHVGDARALAGTNWFFVRALDTIPGYNVGGWKIKGEGQGVSFAGSYNGTHRFDRTRTYRVRAEWDATSVRVSLDGQPYTAIPLPRSILLNGLYLWINHTPRSGQDPPYQGVTISNIVVGQ